MVVGHRFLAAGTIEEKIYQRQLSKEGLQTIVVDEQQEKAKISSEMLRCAVEADAYTRTPPRGLAPASRVRC